MCSWLPAARMLVARPRFGRGHFYIVLSGRLVYGAMPQVSPRSCGQQSWRAAQKGLACHSCLVPSSMLQSLAPQHDIPSSEEHDCGSPTTFSFVLGRVCTKDSLLGCPCICGWCACILVHVEKSGLGHWRTGSYSKLLLREAGERDYGLHGEQRSSQDSITFGLAPHACMHAHMAIPCNLRRAEGGKRQGRLVTAKETTNAAFFACLLPLQPLLAGLGCQTGGRNMQRGGKQTARKAGVGRRLAKGYVEGGEAAWKGRAEEGLPC